nr:hypothetical protein [Klebsiella michiganensis]UWX38021.1 hypothetical protein KJK04_p0085 [Klebsiella quasipneumoniae]UWX38325.1 hypothetical protein KK467_p0085 [Klebsiella pneumoniae]
MYPGLMNSHFRVKGEFNGCPKNSYWHRDYQRRRGNKEIS